MTSKEREKQRWQARRQVDQDDDSGEGACSPEDVLKLNVAGTMMQVKRGVLTQIPQSLLAAKFSGRWDKNSGGDTSRSNTNDDNDGLSTSTNSIYVDVAIEIFRPLVEVLRVRYNFPEFREAPLDVDDFGGNMRLFRRYLGLLQYYGILEIMYPILIEAGKTCSGWSDNNFSEGHLFPIVFGEVDEVTAFKILPNNSNNMLIACYQIDALSPSNNNINNVSNKEGERETTSRIKIAWSRENHTYDWQLFESHREGAVSDYRQNRYLYSFLGDRKDNLDGKSWFVEFIQDGVRLTITRHDDSKTVMQRDLFNQSTGCPVFVGCGVFRLSNVKLSF